jgi:tetratricopeptide (TPR) repeat protein
LYLARGDDYQSLGDHVNAVADFDRALELWPQDAKILRERAWSYRRLKKVKLALADLGLAIKLDPLNPTYLRERMSIYWEQKKFAAALRDLDDAMEFGSYDVDIVANRAHLHLSHSRDYSKAVRGFERATELNPGRPNYWYLLALTYHRLGNCKTVAATKRYLASCRIDGNCPKRKVHESKNLLNGRLRTPKKCGIPTPERETLYRSLWSQFLAGLMTVMNWVRFTLGGQHTN